jgi:hypothetical protein
MKTRDVVSTESDIPRPHGRNTTRGTALIRLATIAAENG